MLEADIKKEERHHPLHGCEELACCNDQWKLADRPVRCAQATLCGVWAALQWPDADVRVVTMGSPAVGNAEFARVSSPSKQKHADYCQTPHVCRQTDAKDCHGFLSACCQYLAGQYPGFCWDATHSQRHGYIRLSGQHFERSEMCAGVHAGGGAGVSPDRQVGCGTGASTLHGVPSAGLPSLDPGMLADTLPSSVEEVLFA